MRKFGKFIVIVLFVWSCSSKTEWTFEKNKLGEIQGKMPMPEVMQILKKSGDSLHKLKKISGIVEQFTLLVSDKKSEQAKYELIFEKGKDTLELTAIEILSPEIVSNKGVSIKDSYEKWKKSHQIGKADRTLRHLVIYVNDLNATLEFSESDLADEAQNRLISDPDPDWVKPEAVPKRLILFMTE